MIISVPVHPLSYKIIRTKHPGQSPIRLKKNDLLLQQLLYHDTRPNHKFLYELLTTSVEFDLGQKHAQRIKNNPSAGYHIYRYHIDTMIQFMFARVSAQLHAWPAMMEWYAIYGIDDDDLAYDTAYKKWQRWQSRNQPLFRRKNELSEKKHCLTTANSVQTLGKRCLSAFELPEDVVLGLAGQYLKDIMPDLFRVDGTLSSSMVQKALIYIYKEFGNYPTTRIARQFGLTERAINYNVSAWRDILDTEPALSEPLESLSPP